MFSCVCQCMRMCIQLTTVHMQNSIPVHCPLCAFRLLAPCQFALFCSRVCSFSTTVFKHDLCTCINPQVAHLPCLFSCTRMRHVPKMVVRQNTCVTCDVTTVFKPLVTLVGPCARLYAARFPTNRACRECALWLPAPPRHPADSPGFALLGAVLRHDACINLFLAFKFPVGNGVNTHSNVYKVGLFTETSLCVCAACVRACVGAACSCTRCMCPLRAYHVACYLCESFVVW